MAIRDWQALAGLALGALTLASAAVVSAQTGRPAPIRLPGATASPSPSASPTPTPSPSPTTSGRPAPIRLGTGATPTATASPAPIRIGSNPAPAPSSSASPAARPAPIRIGSNPTPTPSPAASPVARPAPIRIGTTPVPSPTPAAIAVPPGTLAGTTGIANDRIVAPQISATVSNPASVTLKGMSFEDSVKSQQVVREISGAQLRAGQPIAFGAIQLNFRRMLRNSRALPNIAQRLRDVGPQLAQVHSDRIHAIELPQGMVVRAYMSYTLAPGACSTGAKRAQVAATGVRCFAPLSTSARNAGFANRSDVRYVEDAARRAELQARANVDSAKLQAEIDASVAAFRASLANPAQRAELDAQLGAAAIDRLAALSDADLAGELVNSSENKVEQVFYIPKSENAKGWITLASFAPQQGSPLSAFADALKNMPPPQPIAEQMFPDNTAQIDAPTYTFLTGFTLGREYEWKQRIETTIKWCLVGCKKTYYAELGAKFSYGMGLRFPIRVAGQYNYASTGGVKKATFSPAIAPFNAGPSDYASAGLAANQLFSGKELVAEVKAGAGASAHLPVVGTLGAWFDVGKDFTERLPKPFTLGQFAPPAPGTKLPADPIIFDDFDLIGGRANFGIAGGQIFPAIQASLTSGSLTFDMRDNVSGKTSKLAAGSAPVNLDISEADQTSDFTLSNPEYTVGLELTPGINARLFIDLAVWSNQWDWPIWFPDLKITLPPGGATFACHLGTQCERNYKFDPWVGKAAPDRAAILTKWGQQYDLYWQPKCSDEACNFAIKIVRLGTVLGIKQKLAAITPQEVAAGKDLQLVRAAEYNAAVEASQIITESGFRAQIKAAEDATGALAAKAESDWIKQCADGLCVTQVSALAKQMKVRANELAKANPQWPASSVATSVNTEFAPKFQTVVANSKIRQAALEAGAAVFDNMGSMTVPKGGIKPVL